MNVFVTDLASSPMKTARKRNQSAKDFDGGKLQIIVIWRDLIRLVQQQYHRAGPSCVNNGRPIDCGGLENLPDGTHATSIQLMDVDGLCISRINSITTGSSRTSRSNGWKAMDRFKASLPLGELD